MSNQRVTYPCEALSTGNDLGEATQDDVSDFPEGRLKHNLRLFYLQFDDHYLCLNILQLIKNISKLIPLLKKK